MTDTPPRRLVLWGVGTSRTLRAHWALHELDLDYECRPILPRTGETQTQEYTELNPRQKIPLLQDGELQDRREPGDRGLSLEYLRHPRERADPDRPAGICDLARVVLLCRDRARRDEPLRHAPPRRSEAHLRGSAGGVGKRRLIFRDATASCRAGTAGRATIPGRRAFYHRRHVAHDLPDLGCKLPGAGHLSVPRLSGEDHVSSGLPRRLGG